MIAGEVVHPAQHGFIRGRRLLDNRFDIDFTLISASMRAPPVRGRPLLTWRPRSLAWNGGWSFWPFGASACRGGCAFSFGASSSAAPPSSPWPASRHPQLCSLRQASSGPLWALVFDHIVRAAWYDTLRHGGSLGAFADDMSAAFRDSLCGLAALLPVRLRMRRAAGLRLNLHQTCIINFGTITDDSLQHELLLRTRLQELVVSSEGTSLSFLIAPVVSDCAWDSALRKFVERAAFVRRIPEITGDRLTAYSSLAFSTLRYRTQVRDPSAAVLRAESEALAKILASPMHALSTDPLSWLIHIGRRSRVPPIAFASCASRMRVLATHPHAQELTAQLDIVRWRDDALRHWRAPSWVRSSPLSLVRAEVNELQALPPEVQTHAEQESVFYLHLVRAPAARDVPEIVSRGLRYFVPRAVHDEPLSAGAIVSQSRAGFVALPEIVAFAFLGTLCIAWTTTRRMLHGAEGCRFGCMAVGGDDILHYMACTLLLHAVGALRLWPLSWLHDGIADVFAFFLARGVLRSEMLRAMCWHYL